MTELVKQNSGSLAVVNMREDSRKGAEEIKQEEHPFKLNFFN